MIQTAKRRTSQQYNADMTRNLQGSLKHSFEENPPKIQHQKNFGKHQLSDHKKGVFDSVKWAQRLMCRTFIKMRQVRRHKAKVEEDVEEYKKQLHERTQPHKNFTFQKQSKSPEQMSQTIQHFRAKSHFQSLQQSRENLPQIVQPPIEKHIKMDSGMLDEFSVDSLTTRLFNNKFKHLEYDPLTMTDTKRDDIIRILEKQQSSKRRRASCQTRVEDSYPLFDKSYQLMSKPEKDEYDRLAKLIKYQNQIPDFLRRELSVEGEACVHNNLTKKRKLEEQQKIKNDKKIAKRKFSQQYEEQLPVIQQQAILQSLRENTRDDMPEIGLAKRQSIHQFKLEYCEKKAFKNPHALVQEEPDLIKVFEPKEYVDVYKITQSVLDGTFDDKAEDARLDQMKKSIDTKVKPSPQPLFQPKRTLRRSAHKQQDSRDLEIDLSSTPRPWPKSSMGIYPVPDQMDTMNIIPAHSQTITSHLSLDDSDKEEEEVEKSPTPKPNKFLLNTSSDVQCLLTKQNPVVDPSESKQQQLDDQISKQFQDELLSEDWIKLMSTKKTRNQNPSTLTIGHATFMNNTDSQFANKKSEVNFEDFEQSLNKLGSTTTFKRSSYLETCDDTQKSHSLQQPASTTAKESANNKQITLRVKRFSNFLKQVETQSKRIDKQASPIMEGIEAVKKDEAIIQKQVKKFSKRMTMADRVESLPYDINDLLRLAVQSEKSNQENLSSKEAINQIKREMMKNSEIGIKLQKDAARSKPSKDPAERTIKGKAQQLKVV